MSTVILKRGTATEVQCAAGIFHLYEGDDGSLYVEAPNVSGIKITVSDDHDAEVTATGLWVNITVAAQPGVE